MPRQRCNYLQANPGPLDVALAPSDPHDKNVVALIKGHERYIFIFDRGGQTETLRTLGRFASDPSLSFSWFDAAMLSQAVRNS